MKVTVNDLIQKLLKMPQDLQVIYSIDEEGNAYHPVHFSPTLGRYNEGEFETYGKDDPDNDIEITDCNAVCIN